MQQRLPVVIAGLLALLTAGLFALAGHFGATVLVNDQQTRQLNELADLALRRAETSVRYATGSLDTLQARQLTTCSESMLQSIRFEAYRTGALKDIRLTRTDGSVRCSAFPETLEFDRTWPERSEMLPTADGRYMIFRVDQFDQTGIGVLKDIDADTALVAILVLNPALLDLMPDELRSSSNVLIETDSGGVLAQLHSQNGAGPIRPVSAFSAQSEDYPLRAVVSLDTPLLSYWNQDIYWPIVTLVSALGLSLAILLFRQMVRPESPITAIDKALAAKEFKPYLQPLFDLKTGEIVGAEILARWVRSDGQVIPPARFIKLAEESGRIEQMTWQLLSEALNGARELLKANPGFTLSVNITPHHFMRPGFARELRSAVAAARVSYRQVCIEITEREPFDDLDAAAAVVTSLQSYGFKLALDDVGIGHSGLSHLKGLGANTIKIDKFFVDTVGRDATADSIIQMLVRLARELDMGLVAEGIENRDQIHALIDCGVERGQGYVVSPPLALPAFIDMVVANHAANRSRIPESHAA